MLWKRALESQRESPQDLVGRLRVIVFYQGARKNQDKVKREGCLSEVVTLREFNLYSP